MNQGYRARRPSWWKDHYLLKGEYGDIEQTHLVSVGKFVDGVLSHREYEQSDTIFELKIEDLLADDWEISESKK